MVFTLRPTQTEIQHGTDIGPEDTMYPWKWLNLVNSARFMRFLVVLFGGEDRKEQFLPIFSFPAVFDEDLLFLFSRDCSGNRYLREPQGLEFPLSLLLRGG